MNPEVPLLIKYEGPATNAGIDFSVVGASFIGFDHLLKDLFLISKINGNIEVKTEKIEQSSIDAFLHLYVHLNGLPFENPKYLYEFLQVAAPDLVTYAKEVISTARSIEDGLDTFFRDRPFSALLIQSYLLYLFRKHRNKRPCEDERIPDRVYKRLSNLYKTGRFKKALSPLRENGYDKITFFRQEAENSDATVILDRDLDAYLPEEEQILPFLLDGDIMTFHAKVVGLSSTRGEVVTLSATDLERKTSVYHAFPPTGDESSMFKQYYGQEVTVEAVVIRKNNNLYKRPDFNIISMEQTQTVLNLE